MNIKCYGWGQEKCCLESYGIASQGLQLSSHAAKRPFLITLILNQWVYGKDLDKRIFVCHFVLGSFLFVVFLCCFIGGGVGWRIIVGIQL